MFENIYDLSKDVPLFFEFTRHMESCVYITPNMYQDLIKQLKIDEDVFSYVNSLIDDGGLVMGNTDFGDDRTNILFLAYKLSIFNPDKHIVIIKCKDEKINLKDLPDVVKNLISEFNVQTDVTDLDLESIRGIIKLLYHEYSFLVFGENS